MINELQRGDETQVQNNVRLSDFHSNGSMAPSMYRTKEREINCRMGQRETSQKARHEIQRKTKSER